MDRSGVAVASFVFYAALSLFLFGCGARYRLQQSGRKLAEPCRYDGPSHANCAGRFPAPHPAGDGFWLAICECPCHGCVDCRRESR